MRNPRWLAQQVDIDQSVVSSRVDAFRCRMIGRHRVPGLPSVGLQAAHRHAGEVLCLPRSPSLPLPPVHAKTHQGKSIGSKELPDCLVEKQTV
jgi:hypothetical protein